MYFIFDANGELFGNSKGYKTYKAAQCQCTKQRYKLWHLYDHRINKNSNEIWRIDYIAD